MKNQAQITFKNLPSSDALSALIHQEADKLDRFHDGITSCHVLLEMPHRHRTHGQQIHVRIDLAVPGTTIVVERDLVEGDGHQNAYVAVSEAFHTARRRLQEHLRRLQRKDRHEKLPEGVPTRRRRPPVSSPPVA